MHFGLVQLLDLSDTDGLVSLSGRKLNVLCRLWQVKQLGLALLNLSG